MRKLLALLVTVAMLASLSAGALAAGMTPGTYTETVKGMFDGLTVDVVVTEDAIESVTVVSHNETSPGWPAIERLPGEVVANQTWNVDAIAGATMSSNGIRDAVKAALEKAGADMEKFGVEAGAQELAASYYPVMGSFEVPETWDESYDVVVVGSGFAGMAAAYSAAQAGASTLLIEKLSMTGGNSAINGGQYAAYTSKIAAKLQAEFNLVPDTAAKHMEDTLVGGDNMGVPRLVEVMVKGAPYFFDLLLDNGLKVRDTLARPGGHYGYRTYSTENFVGSDITNIERQMVDGSPVKLELDTKMVEIYRTRDDANRVVGIRVATADGYKTVEAVKGVILATGGFSSNVQMRETQVPYLSEDIPTTNNKSASTGEGIYLAQAIGANTTQMSNIQRYPFADAANGVLDKYAVWPFSGPSYGIVYVDYQGNRYVSEGERRDVCANAAVNTGFISTYSIFTWDVVQNYVTPEELEEGVASGRVMRADTLEELAEKINAYEVQGQYPSIDGATLVATIDRHNGFIESGVDEDFAKVMAATMKPMLEGPYYALTQFPSVHHTMGGLVIDECTQVYDIFGQVIPGLYAAGEVTGGVHGTNRLGSNADADACTFGYIAGYYVATGEYPEFMFAEPLN